MALTHMIRRTFNQMGLDLIRLKNSPRKTLLGMSRMPFKTVIDVGANKGQFAQGVSEFFPGAQIFCFEPLEAPYRELADWASLQNGRVQCFNTALGESQGEMPMHQHVDHSPSSSLLAATATCHELYPQTRAENLTTIKITTLDQALGDLLPDMPRDILLKLDVQGFEDRVLRGGPQVLSQCRSVVLEVSTKPLYQEQANFRVITELMYDAGLRYVGNLDQAYDPHGQVVFLDAVFQR